MDWAKIIKNEFEKLKIENEKESTQFWNRKKATVNGHNNMTMWVPIRRNFVSNDSEELRSRPNLGDDMMDDSFVDDFISKDNGNTPGAKTDAIDDEMFVKLVRKLMPYQKYMTSMVQASPSQTMDKCDGNASNVEQVTNPDPIIFQKISAFFNGNYTADKYVMLTKSDSKLSTCTPNIDEPMKVALDPDQSLHSYRTLLCRRCWIYGCQLHTRSENTDENFRNNNVEELKTFAAPCSGTCYLRTEESNDVTGIGEENVVAETVIQNTAAVSDADKVIDDQTDVSGNTFSDIFPLPLDATADIVSGFDDFLLDTTGFTSSIFDDILIWGSASESENTEAKNSDDEWSFSDQTLFLVLLKVFPHNCCAIAEALRKSCEQVFKRMQSTDEATNRNRVVDIEKKPCKKERPKTNGDLQQHLSKTYSPCNHQEACNKTSNCLCLFCEKFCSCGMDCRKRSPKCACKGACMTSKCVCYFGQRECDPEICECIGCRNVGIQFGNEKKLRVVASTMHGWGVAVTETCQKSDFVAEYKGEIMSTEECERRGKEYDKKGCTYMFSLNSDTLIDGMRFGNKIRFANSSKDPNCYCRVMMVNGDRRIGVYASRAIAAGEELTIACCTHDPTITKEN